MIEITRALARQLRAVFRKSIGAGALRCARPMMSFLAGRDGLRVRFQHSDVAVEYHQAGTRAVESLTVPFDALQDFEGRADSVVVLETTGADTAQARWNDDGIPQVRDYPSAQPDEPASWPDLPEQFTNVGPGLVTALDLAAQTAARESVRYALTRLQLRGGPGEIVSTDSRQLLVQGGFAFPWNDDLLVPAVGVWGSRDLGDQADAAIGKTATHVCLRLGPWTLFLSMDTEGPFPPADEVIPRLTDKGTTWQLAPGDAAFLARVLPRLPGGDDENAPVTVDLDKDAVVRAKGDGQSCPTEVVLNGSEVAGPAVRIVTNRRYLTRAVALGFTEFHVTEPEVAVVCRESQRTYLWMPLGKDLAVAPSANAIRITATADQPAAPARSKERSKARMSSPRSNGRTNGHATPEREAAGRSAPSGSSLDALIQETEALREVTRDTYGRVSRLLAALKCHKKQSRLMATTLASLRQLQHLQPVAD